MMRAMSSDVGLCLNLFCFCCNAVVFTCQSPFFVLLFVGCADFLCYFVVVCTTVLLVYTKTGGTSTVHVQGFR